MTSQANDGGRAATDGGSRAGDAGSTSTGSTDGSSGGCDPATDPTCVPAPVNLSYSWQLQNLADGGPAATCANLGVTDLVLVLTDSSGNEHALDTLDCSTMSGTWSTSLSPGIWNAAYEVVQTPLSLVTYDTPAVAEADVGFILDGGASATIPLGIVQYADAPLQVTIVQGTKSVSCAEAGASAIVLQLTLPGGAITQTVSLSCGSLTTGPIGLGHWSVQASLQDNASHVLASWTSPSPYIVAPPSVGPLGPITFVAPESDAAVPDAGIADASAGD